MSDDGIIIRHVTEKELLRWMSKGAQRLDKLAPGWRNNIADCCIGCSDIPHGEAMRTLVLMNEHHFLLAGPCGREDFVEFVQRELK